MAKKRRSIGSALKSQVALVAARGDKTTAELSSHFGVHLKTRGQTSKPASVDDFSPTAHDQNSRLKRATQKEKRYSTPSPPSKCIQDAKNTIASDNRIPKPKSED